MVDFEMTLDDALVNKQQQPPIEKGTSPVNEKKEENTQQPPPTTETPITDEKKEGVETEKKEGDEKKEIENKEEGNLTEFYLENDTKYLGLDLNDEQKKMFNDIDLETVEGHSKYVQQISKITADKEIDRIFDSFPEIDQQYLKYRANGGTPEDFWDTRGDIDFSAIKIEKKDISTQLDMIAQSYMELSDGKITYEEGLKMARMYADSGKSYEESITAQNKLVALQKEKTDIAIKEQETVKQQQYAKAEQERKVIEDKITNGLLEVGEQKYIIPDNIRKQMAYEHFNYYVDDKGNYVDKNMNPTTNKNEAITIADVRYFTTSLDSRLLQYWQLLSGTDKIVQNMMKQEKINTLRKAMSNKNLPNNQKLDINKGTSNPQDINWQQANYEVEK